MIEKNRINGNKRKIAAIGAAVALAVGLAACGSTVEKAPQSPPASTSTEQGPQQETPEKSLRPISSETDPEALAGYVQKVADLSEELYQGVEIWGADELINGVELAQSSPAESANILTNLGLTQESFRINETLYREVCSSTDLVKAYESLGAMCPYQLTAFFKDNGVIELLPENFDSVDTVSKNGQNVAYLLDLITTSDVRKSTSVPKLIVSLMFSKVLEIPEISNTDLTKADAPEEMGYDNWINALLFALEDVNFENNPTIIGIKDPEQKKAYGDHYETVLKSAIPLVAVQ